MMGEAFVTPVPRLHGLSGILKCFAIATTGLHISLASLLCCSLCYSNQIVDLSVYRLSDRNMHVDENFPEA